MTQPATIEPINPVKLGNGGVHYAPGVRAGDWIFASGHMAQDYGAGIAADVLRPRAPNAEGPKRARESKRIFDSVEAVLTAGGASLERIVRTDQFYPSVAMVPPFQAERRRRLGGQIPPSTSIVQQALLLPGAELDWQVIAVASGGPAIRHIDNAALRARPTSGYSPALTVGDFVFVPGNTAMAQGEEPRRDGLAQAALIEDGVQWGGEPIRREAEFIVTERILPSLELAGVGAHDVVKAQIYLSEPEACAVVADVWHAYFGASRAALSIIPCAVRGLAPIGGKIEINVLAHDPAGDAPKVPIEAGVVTPFEGQPQAVRAGDLLFLSGLLAIDDEGIVPAAETDPRQPHFADRAEAQADAILDAAAKLCAAAGTTLANVVRAQQFHTDLADFLAVYRAWQRQLPGQPIPFSAVEVPGPLAVPGCTVMLDLWVYAPQR